MGSAGLTALLIVTPKGAVLLDTGMPQYAGMVEKNIQSLGFKQEFSRLPSFAGKPVAQ